jgi:hypothetical protein
MYKDEGFLPVTLFGESDVSDARAWALESNLSFPVLVDKNKIVADRYYNNRTPANHLVGPGMELLMVNKVLTIHELEDYLEEIYGD